MELKDLRQFVAVAEAGGFRRASLGSDIRQSVLSRRVRALEDELGVSLFERSVAGVRLTVAGNAFLHRIRPILSDLGSAVATAAQAGVGQNGCLQIGLMVSLAQGPQRELIGGFARQHADVQLRFVDGERGELLEQIRHRRIDAALLMGEVAQTQGDSLVLGRARLWSALPATHHAAAKPTLDWADLKDDTFLVSAAGDGPAIHDHVAQRLSGHLGEQPAVIRHPVGCETLMHLVGLGLGTSVVCEAATAVVYPDVRFRPIKDEPEAMAISLVWLPDNDNPALRRFNSVARMIAEGRMPAVTGATASLPQTRDPTP